MPRPVSPQPNPFYRRVIPCAARDLLLILTSILLCFLISCSGPTKFDPTSLTFLIESNSVNLDPRFATDGQSHHLDGLIFSGLLARDAQMNLHADLAAPWQTPHPITTIFHSNPHTHLP